MWICLAAFFAQLLVLRRCWILFDGFAFGGTFSCFYMIGGVFIFVIGAGCLSEFILGSFARLGSILREAFVGGVSVSKCMGSGLGASGRGKLAMVLRRSSRSVLVWGINLPSCGPLEICFPVLRVAVRVQLRLLNASACCPVICLPQLNQTLL